MKRNIALLLFGLTIFAFCVSCGNRGAKKNEAEKTEQQTIVAEEASKQVLELSDSIFQIRSADTVAFGVLSKGVEARRHFEVVNSGDKPFVIVSADISCGCIALDYPRKPIMVGESADMLLVLDTEDQRGIVYKTVRLKTSLNAKEYLLVVTAEVE